MFKYLLDLSMKKGWAVTINKITLKASKFPQKDGLGPTFIMSCHHLLLVIFQKNIIVKIVITEIMR